MMVVMMMTLVIALLPPLAVMMAVAGLLDDAVLLAQARHIAENVAGDRSRLRGAGDEEESACNCGEGE